MSIARIDSDEEIRITWKAAHATFHPLQSFSAVIVLAPALFGIPIGFVIGLSLHPLGMLIGPALGFIIGLAWGDSIYSKIDMYRFTRTDETCIFLNSGDVILNANKKISLNDISSFEIGNSKDFKPQDFGVKEFPYTMKYAVLTVVLRSGKIIPFTFTCAGMAEQVEIMAALKTAHAEALQVLDGYI